MPDPIVTLSRCLHVLGAIVLLGGAIFTRYVLMPAASQLPEGEHDQLKRGIAKRWKPFLHGGITIVLLSGFYNYWIAMGPHKGDGKYHMLMGIKILLAMVVFFIASVLPGRIPAFEGMRRNARTWLTITILCATVVVAIAGFLKVRPIPARSAPAEVEVIETATTESQP